MQSSTITHARWCNVTGLEEWRRVSKPCGDNIEEVLQAEAARIEAAFNDERLEAMVKAGGVDGGTEG